MQAYSHKDKEREGQPHLISMREQREERVRHRREHMQRRLQPLVPLLLLLLLSLRSDEGGGRAKREEMSESEGGSVCL